MHVDTVWLIFCFAKRSLFYRFNLLMSFNAPSARHCFFFLRHQGIVGHRALRTEINKIVFARGCTPQEAFMVARHVKAPTQQTNDIPTAAEIPGDRWVIGEFLLSLGYFRKLNEHARQRCNIWDSMQDFYMDCWHHGWLLQNETNLAVSKFNPYPFISCGTPFRGQRSNPQDINITIYRQEFFICIQQLRDSYQPVFAISKRHFAGSDGTPDPFGCPKDVGATNVSIFVSQTMRPSHPQQWG